MSFNDKADELLSYYKSQLIIYSDRIEEDFAKVPFWNFSKEIPWNMNKARHEYSNYEQVLGEIPSRTYNRSYITAQLKEEINSKLGKYMYSIKNNQEKVGKAEKAAQAARNEAEKMKSEAKLAKEIADREKIQAQIVKDAANISIIQSQAEIDRAKSETKLAKESADREKIQAQIAKDAANRSIAQAQAEIAQIKTQSQVEIDRARSEAQTAKNDLAEIENLYSTQGREKQKYLQVNYKKECGKYEEANEITLSIKRIIDLLLSPLKILSIFLACFGLAVVSWISQGIISVIIFLAIPILIFILRVIVNTQYKNTKIKLNLAKKQFIEKYGMIPPKNISD